MTKRANPFILFAVVFSFLYILLAVRPLSDEIHFSTKWTVSSAKKTVPDGAGFSSEELIPFKSGQTAGYFTADGKIVSSFSFPYKASVAQDSYALYGTGDREIKIFSNLNGQTGTISLQGFPFFTENGKFIMLPGGSSFASLNADGSEKWRFENYVPLTAFSSSVSGVIAGYADGTIKTFDADGKVLQEYVPGGSAQNVIFGAAISPSGVFSACVSGLGRQRFVLAKKDEGLTSIVFHEYLPSESNRQQLVQFSGDGKKCFFAFDGGLGIVDCASLKSSHISVEGRVLSLCEAEEQDCVFVLTKKKDRYFVYVIENFDFCQGKFSYRAESSFITVKDGVLFVGKDSSISRIEISRK